MKIEINTLTNKKFHLDVEEEETIENIKEKIVNVKGLDYSKNNLDLYSNKKKLNSDYKLKNKKKLYLILNTK